MFRAMLRPEDTEKDLVDAMEMYVRRAGGKCTRFPTIVAVRRTGRLAARAADRSAHRRAKFWCWSTGGPTGRFTKAT